MISKQFILLTTVCGSLLSGTAMAAPYSDAFKDIYDRLRVRGLVSFQYIAEDNDDHAELVIRSLSNLDANITIEHVCNGEEVFFALATISN